MSSLLILLLALSDTRLADAAMKRDTAAVRALIEQHVDVNAAGTDGTPALSSRNSM